MSSIFNLKDKVAVITGGRRGIGYALALGLAKEGVDIVVIGKSKEAGTIEKEIKKYNRKFIYIQCDLANRDDRKNLIEKIVNKMGKIDILINNAGVQTLCAAKDYSFSQWDFEMELMLTAVFDLSSQAYTFMEKQKSGKIIQIASISSYQGARNIIGYSTAKHALIGMIKCMSNEWAIDGININGIAPGIIETDMSKDTVEDKQKADILKSRIPSGKFGKPEDIVGTAIYLCSDASNHVNGTVITIDGGWLGR